jgi:hypothetical protein
MMDTRIATVESEVRGFLRALYPEMVVRAKISQCHTHALYI